MVCMAALKCPLCAPQKVLFSLGGSFLYYADRFKIYSAFCASHTKVPKVLSKGERTCWSSVLPVDEVLAQGDVQ